MDPSNRETSFRNTGAVEQDRPEQNTNVAPLEEQLDHRFQDPLNKSNDSGLPGQGQTPEFSGEEQVNNQLDKDTNAVSSEAVNQELTRRSNAMDKMDTTEDRSLERDDLEDETNQDPGEQQKENQNEKKDDDLAA